MWYKTIVMKNTVLLFFLFLFLSWTYSFGQTRNSHLLINSPHKNPSGVSREKNQLSAFDYYD